MYFLSEKLEELTRSNIKKIINSNKVKINNLVVEASQKKLKGEKIVTDLLSKQSNKYYSFKKTVRNSL